MDLILTIIQLFLGLIMVICAMINVFFKKQINFNYIEKSKKVTFGNHFTGFDGRWFFVKLDLDIIPTEEKDRDFYKKVKIINLTRIVTIILFVIIILGTYIQSVMF